MWKDLLMTLRLPSQSEKSLWSQIVVSAALKMGSGSDIILPLITANNEATTAHNEGRKGEREEKGP